MSNQFCQLLATNYDYKNLTKDSTDCNIEDIPNVVNSCSTYSQQQILEQLLLTLTNQLALQATHNSKNINQHALMSHSNFSSDKLGSNERTTNEKSFGNDPVLQKTINYNRIAEIATSSNKMNNLYNFPQSNRSSEADEDEERERETETEEDEDEDDELTTCNKMLLNNHLKADELVNLESFNLDTHLDLKRYMYFNNAQQDLLPPTETQTINSETGITVDCNFLFSGSSQLSSSSNSSSNSSISNLCKTTINTVNSNTKSTLTTAEFPESTNRMPSTHLLLSSQQPKRPVSYLSQLSGYLSSSSDCLSGDEGYSGSYSDKKILSKQKSNSFEPQNNHQNRQDHQNSHHSESINQNEQVILLNYLLQNQHITQANNIAARESETDSKQEQNILDSQIPCLNIFNSFQDQEEKNFTSLLLENSTDFSDVYSNINTDWSRNKFDVKNLLSTTEKNLYLQQKQTDNEKIYVRNGLRLKEEILDILKRQDTERTERERLEEIELRTLNWRRLLEQRSKIEQARLELNQEDQIDCNAYLNEIEMNLDHFQSYDLEASDPAEDILIDTLLKFRTNRMAFNLRNYHRSLELEKERRRLIQEDQENKKKQNMFANFHVDSIPEFTPYSTVISDQYYDQYESNTDLILRDQDLDYENCNELDEIFLLNDQYQQQDLIENDYTMVDEGANEAQIYDENGYLVASGYEEVEPGDLVDSVDSEFIYEEDYEDYEDQILVDSLSEQDALKLLRNESEMYALQMAQASKSGLLPKTKSHKKKKGRFDSGTSSITTLSTDTQSTDIFENVFNFDEVVRSATGFTTDSSSDLASSAASVSGTTESENIIADGHELDFDINEFFMPQLCQEQGNGNISNSLRNSLLKLRHTRRHLAKLIDSKKNLSLSDGSSSSGSLTNLNTQLGTQPTKQITISALSRKPCVYMLNEGRCMRADCRFAHDLKQITCKYWIDGECLKGENCEFLHELIEEATPPPSSKLGKQKAPKSIPIKKKDFKLDTEEFPALGGIPAPGSLPKPTEFPTLSASPISTVTTIIQSPKEFLINKIKTSPATTVIKTAASVLKTTAASIATPVVVANLVSNKAQQLPIAANKPVKSINSANLSQKQRKQQLKSKNSSIASSSCSSINTGNKL